MDSTLYLKLILLLMVMDSASPTKGRQFKVNNNVIHPEIASISVVATNRIELYHSLSLEFLYVSLEAKTVSSLPLCFFIQVALQARLLVNHHELPPDYQPLEPLPERRQPEPDRPLLSQVGFS